MAKYDARVAATALGVPEDWLSSLLTRFSVAGVEKRRQGSRRKLSRDAIICLAVAQTLIEEVSVPAEAALALAHDLVRRPDARIPLRGGTVQLACDISALRLELMLALDRAVGQAVDVPRGRPRRLHAS